MVEIPQKILQLEKEIRSVESGLMLEYFLLHPRLSDQEVEEMWWKDDDFVFVPFSRENAVAVCADPNQPQVLQLWSKLWILQVKRNVLTAALYPPDPDDEKAQIPNLKQI